MPDTPPDTGGPSGLNRRVLGGIPLWGVYAIGLAVLVVGLTWWRSRQAANATANTPTQDAGTDSGTPDSLDAGSLSVLQTEILALQGAKSTPGPPGPVGPAGPPGKPGSPPPKPPPAHTPSAPEVRTYQVKPGDSLSKIADHYYGNPTLWTRIFAANKSGIRRANGTPGMIKNPDLIQPGWMLVIP